MDRRKFVASLAGGTFFSLLPTLSAIPSSKAQAATATDLGNIDVIATAALIRSRSVSMLEVTRAAMNRIDRLNPKINAVVTKTYDYGIRQIVAGRFGPLKGVPYLLKDLNPLKGVRLTNGSRLFSSYTAEETHAATKNLLAKGLVILGKTNTPEFGLLPTTEPLANGSTRNPWNLNHSSGGSSGGASAAVAAGMVPAADSSDGGGSIRFPAAACNLFGLKPSRGRITRLPNPARFIDLSVQHTVSHTVRDSAFMLALHEGPQGAPGVTLPPIGYVEGASRKKRKIALSYNVLDVTPDADTRKSIDRVARALENRGHEVDVVNRSPHDNPNFSQAFTKIWAGGARALLALAKQRIGISAFKSHLLEPNTLRFLAAVSPATAADKKFVFQTIAEVTASFDAFMANYDAWLTPMSPIPSPRLGYFSDANVSFENLLKRVEDFSCYSPLHNVLGTPSMSVPSGFSAAGIPIGAQIASTIGREDMLLDLAYQIEDDLPWADKKPALLA